MENFPFLPHNGDSEGQVERNFMPVPHTIPFYGTVDEALIHCAYHRVKNFLQAGPEHPKKYDALAYLEIASTLATARKHLVHSIFWQKASYETRLQISLQLDCLSEQIQKNIEQFGIHWNKYIETLDYQPVDIIELPDYIEPNNTEQVQRYQSITLGELSHSMSTLQELTKTFSHQIIPKTIQQIKPTPTYQQKNLFEQS